MIIRKVHCCAFTLLFAYVSSTTSFIGLFNRYLLSVYYVPGIAEVLVRMTDEFLPPGADLLVGAAMRRASEHTMAEVV